MSQPPDLPAARLLETLTSGALVVGRDQRIVYSNPVLADMSGYAPGQLQGQPLSMLIQLPPKTDCALCLGLGEQWATFHGAVLLVSPERGQAEEMRVKIKHSPYGQDGSVLCLLDRFSEDTTLTQAHSDFVSTVSHEFRTPLTSIKGFADTLLSYGTQLPEEEKRRFINIIKDQADRLIRLVENLLTVSKLGAGRQEMSYRPLSLKRLLDKTVESIQAKCKTPRRFEIELKPEQLEVWADADRFEQVLLNLIDNAVKYSRPDTVVRIRGEFLPEDDTRIRIQISDQGAGIPAELLPKLFTKFYRVEGPLKSDVEGTGLGLYITKSLTNAMGGEINVQSEVGQGSTFTLIFPAATPERQAAHRRRLYAEETAPP